jgi:histidinol-phosphate aminotransferase
MAKSPSNSTESNEPSELSRRSFFRAAGMAAAAIPILGEAHFAFAQKAADDKLKRGMRPQFPPGATLINANENPLGPCKDACAAIASIAPLGGRYDLEGKTAELVKTFASQNGLKEENISVYAGSSEPLHYVVCAFTGPDKALVTADPTYEAAWHAATVSGAPVHKIELEKVTFKHDVKALVAAAPTAGLIYICNPNNPTGTLTPREDILWALENKPKGSILLVDEAYIHLSEAPNVLDQVAAGKDLIVLRTFSKVYGMAGIRCGFAIGRPDLLAKLQPYLQNAMPITSSAAAHASLLDAALVPTRRKWIADSRTETLAFLEKTGYPAVPGSESNCFMIDCRRPGKEVIDAMAAKNVFIGRVWPVWPNHVRVTVGSPEDMKKFMVAFKEVMDAPATPKTARIQEKTKDGVKLA